MKPILLTLLPLAGALLLPLVGDAAPPVRWRLPKNSDIYLVEDDLVYARFLALAREGTYSQINRDEHGSTEVDRGRWEQDAAGTIRLHSTCRALRPRSLRGGPLYVVIAGQEQIEALPRLLVSMRRFLGEYADAVFDAASASEMDAPGAPGILVEHGTTTFDRADADALAARIVEVLECERSCIYGLEPMKSADTALYILPGNAFRETDLPTVRRDYRVGAPAAPPFYFARIDVKTYVREVGRWQPLHLPGNLE